MKRKKVTLVKEIRCHLGWGHRSRGCTHRGDNQPLRSVLRTIRPTPEVRGAWRSGKHTSVCLLEQEEQTPPPKKGRQTDDTGGGDSCPLEEN